MSDEKQWYEKLYENFSEKYDNECFAGGTVGEVDFIEKELNFNKNLSILDIGCGTGRHTIELSSRGYSVTGIDLSDTLLKKAVEKSEKLNLKIDFQKKDARKLTFENMFDAAIMLCGGAFPLMETDEMNYEILKNAAKSLKTPGKFIFTTMNGLFPLFHSVDKFCNSSAKDGNPSYRESAFDLMTFRDYSSITIEDDSGVAKTLKCNERFYVPSEITWLLKSVGFAKIDIYGAKLGAYSRNDILTTDDFEMLVVAEKLT